MKQLFRVLVFFALGNLVFSQEQQLYTNHNVKEMAVFPGCESIDPTHKKEMNDCISKEVSDRLIKNLKGVDESLRQSGIYDARADIQFIISKEGIILGVKETEGSNPILADAAVMAMEYIAMELPPIRPARLQDGSAVNLVFQLPIVVELEENDNVLTSDQYPVDEIVLFTLQDETDIRYEIRLFKNKDINIYEIKNHQTDFLGKYLTLNEVESSEPYKSLIDKNRDSNKILVTDGFLEKEFFEIYVYNLFDESQTLPVFVEVVKVDDEKRQSISKFEKETEFNQSRFAPLIYRD